MGIQHLSITDITLDPELQSRVHIDVQHWREIADWLNANPDQDTAAIRVVFDGETHWVADGFHRAPAYRAAKRTVIPAEVQNGSRRDALLLSFGVNATHGLKRTDNDKRRAVLAMLADTEWGQWSSRKIAEQCSVSHNLVAQIRRESASVIDDTYQNRKESAATVSRPTPPAAPATVKFERGGKVHTQRVQPHPAPLSPERYPDPAPKRRESDEANMERCRENFRRLCRELSPANTERLKPALVAMEEALEM